MSDVYLLHRLDGYHQRHQHIWLAPDRVRPVATERSLDAQ
jgi:hypothetical protein